MKSKKDILKEIETLKKSRDGFVVSTRDWNMLEYAIGELEWVVEG